MSKEAYDEIGQQLQSQHEVVISQLFGKPCLKIRKKAFAAFYKGEMVFKLGMLEVNLLREKYIGSSNWDPSGKGRAMKDWLQVPEEYQEDWQGLALKALDYVQTNN